MSDIQVKFIGDDAEEAQKQFEKLIKKHFGGDAIIQTLGGTVQALTAVTFVLTVSTLLASPHGIFQQLTKNRQSAFLEHLQKFVRDHNVELVFTLPDGRRVDFRTMAIDELRDLLNGKTKE